MGEKQKLTEPALQEASSALHTGTEASRSSMFMPIAPPVVMPTTTSQRARTPSVIYFIRPVSLLGLPSLGSRACR